VRHQENYDQTNTPTVIREEDLDIDQTLDRIFEVNFNPITLLSKWKLSFKAIVTLSQYPELVLELASERTKVPLSPNYTPSIIEVFYDDILCVRYRDGQVTYPNYSPANSPFMEIRFDDQMALFVVEGDVVVDRIKAMADLDEMIGRLLTLDRRMSR
jgi:hypothetical protein